MIKSIIKSVINSYKRLLLRKKHIVIERNVSTSRTKFTEYNKIQKNSAVNDSTLGVCTYICWNCILNNVKVGAYTSIAPFVEVVYGRHPLEFVSTHPAFFSMREQCGMTFTNKQLYVEFSYVKDTEKSVVIGNDVWIGYGAKIIEGVTIGDGAVIFAGAMVTKDVEPYSIVGGVPAKHIKYRFNLEFRELLLEFKWWEKDISWVRANAKYFINMNNFVKMIKEKQ